MVYNNPYFQPQYQQPQQTGLVSVPNIEAARNYPVAPGNSVTFKDENAPYIYTKTQGFSQLDHPVFEKYRLTKEEDTPAQEYALKADLEKAISELRKEIKDGYAKHVGSLLTESTGFTPEV